MKNDNGKIVPFIPHAIEVITNDLIMIEKLYEKCLDKKINLFKEFQSYEQSRIKSMLYISTRIFKVLDIRKQMKMNHSLLLNAYNNLYEFFVTVYNTDMSLIYREDPDEPLGFENKDEQQKAFHWNKNALLKLIELALEANL